MSLPPALLARLKKRGIINDSSSSSSKDADPEPPSTKSEEEVIAENYDEDDVTPIASVKPPSSYSTNTDAMSRSSHRASNFKYSRKRIDPIKGCPNKVNLYHDCSEYCYEKYGEGADAPSPRTERRYRSLVKRFPLPLGWVDVWEPGVQRYYFWHTETDKVSWLPPSHPKANISDSVYKMKSDLHKANKSTLDSGSDEIDDDDDNDDDDDDDDDDSSDVDSQDTDSSSSGNDDGRDFRRKIRTANDLDPMDPASYSTQCPRGKWSDGLTKRGDD